MEDPSVRFSGTGPVAPPPRPVVFGRGAATGPGIGKPGPGPGPGPASQFGAAGIAAGSVGFKLSAAAAATTAASENGTRSRAESRSPPPRSRSGIPSGRAKGPGLARMPSSSEGAVREEEAKARRMKRFGAEQAELVPAARDVPFAPAVSATREKSPAGDQMVEDQDWPVVEGGDAILGTCPDMCPEVERLARERKGDLDKFERLDGDRTQSSVHLAVKKYTRTAEKEASVIRPLPVLQRTVNHLLKLIERPYDDELVSLHSFLWDRMRAVRMDLRMQHIFNQDAISMHEQMIRFHILAMHELCEYAKGEGFNEGFDPHLNIEQMNKASVDLFEMYDDHRKRGTPVASEAEFRGYYALLKLDKHPGYLVEPAELSLDLAKMTAEMRNTPEVLFARMVARASRSGNYIAFFRLARRATYLQACLMHAHFSKLRSQALYSLHSGLQKNQGIPVSQVVEWLGMEGEDVNILISYSGTVGFSVKEYEKNYLVKEGPYSSWQGDFPTRRSRLVAAKQSVEVVADVQSRIDSIKDSAVWPIVNISVPSSPTPEEDMPDYEDQDVGAFNTVAGLETGSASSLGESPSLTTWMSANIVGSPNGPTSIGSWNAVQSEAHQVGNKRKPYEEDVTIHKRRDTKVVTVHERLSFEQKSEMSMVRRREEELLQRKAAEAAIRSFEESTARKAEEVALYHLQIAQRRAEEDARKKAQEDEERRLFAIALERKKHEEELRIELHREEAYSGKARLWFRRWKSRTTASLLWKQRRMERAEAALSSLSAGPPLLGRKQGSGMELTYNMLDFVELNVDQVLSDRSKKLTQMWASLDVPALAAPILIKNNLPSQSICWKLAVCTRLNDKQESPHSFHGSHGNVLGDWLWAKMTKISSGHQQSVKPHSTKGQGNKYSPVAVEEMNINGVSFCFVLRDVAFNGGALDGCESLYGASGVVFLMAEAFDTTSERRRLHALVDAIAPGSQLPLLVIASRSWKTCNWKRHVDGITHGIDGITHGVQTAEEQLALALHLRTFDANRVRSSSIVFIGESPNPEGKLSNVFLDDKSLQESLSWLAEQAPKQPNLRSLHVRDLVLEHLEIESQSLTYLAPTAVEPQDCISVFNCAVRKASQDIRNAASASPLHWPPPEYQPALPGSQELPTYGWNLPGTVQPIIQVLDFCALPPFPPHVASEKGMWSHGGRSSKSSTVPSRKKTDLLQSIDVQKMAIGQTLQHYICQVDGISENSLATRREVDEILQTGCTVDWLDLGRATVVPLWLQIFRRIFHSRLLLLCSEPPPIVYVLPRRLSAEAQVGELGAKRSVFSGGYFYKRPRLDDIVQQYTLSSRKAASPIVQRAERRFPSCTRAPNLIESWLPISTPTEEHSQVLEVERAEQKVNDMLDQLSVRLDSHHSMQHILEGPQFDFEVKDTAERQSEIERSLRSSILASDGPFEVALAGSTTPGWASNVDADSRLQELIDNCEKAQAVMANRLKGLGIASSETDRLHNWVTV